MGKLLTKIRQNISRSEWRESLFAYCMLTFVFFVILQSFNWHGFVMFLFSLTERFLWVCFGFVLLLALCVLYLIPATAIGLLLKGALLLEYPTAKIAKQIWPRNKWANRVIGSTRPSQEILRLTDSSRITRQPSPAKRNNTPGN